MAVNGYVAHDGVTYYRKINSGDGTIGNPVVLEFADPTAHTKIDLVRTTLLGALTSTPLRVSAMGTAASGVIKNSPGTLFSIACTNLSANARYIQLFNTTSAPSAGATPFRSYPLYSSGGFTVIDAQLWGAIQSSIGLSFSTGISWGFSTTALTYTAGTATDCIFEASYL